MNEPLYDREGMARMIRMFFIQGKTTKTAGGKYRPNPRHDTLENWLRAADACIANRANPQDWVDASFALCPATLFANQLGGPAAAQRWREHMNRGSGSMLRPVEPPRSPAVSTPKSSSANLSVLNTKLLDEIKDELFLAHQLMSQKTGSPYALDNREMLNDSFTSIRPHVRVAIAGRAGMTDILVKFHKEALDFFSRHPQHVECFLTLGYNMRKYLNVT